MDIRDIIEQIIKPQIKQPLWESWYIKEKIGSGSFSVVYRIEAQRPGGIDVSALKVEAIMSDGQIFADSTRKTTFLNSRKQMAINEAQIMKKLRDCPYIVRYEEEHMQDLYIDGKFEGYYYLIRMELLQNVYELMRDGKFSYSESNVRKLASEIGQGLKAAHSIGIIHRDIKPDNMFINGAGVYKLGDFNISKKAVSTRTYAGTQYYMAPEIYRARTTVDASYTTQADIYSFGLCLYQMTNKGQLPFEDKLNPDAAYDKRMSDERASFPPPCDASSDFARIILKACSFNPNERYRTIDDMLMDLGGKRVTTSNATQYANAGHSSTQRRGNPTEYAGTSSQTPSRRSNATEYAGNDSSYDRSYGAKTHSIKPIVIGVAVILLIVGIVLGITKCNKSDDEPELANSTIESEQPSDTQDSVVGSIKDESLSTTSEIETTMTTTTTQPETSTTTTTTIPTKMEYLANMELFADGSSNSTGGKSYIRNKYLTDNYRNTYSSSICVESGYLSYLVKDMGYTHFCGTVALPKEISTDGYKTSAQLEIYIDEVLAFRSEDITNGSKPESFDIDITGAEVIKLSWSCKGGNIWSNWCYFATVFDPYCADDAYIEKISGETQTTSIQVADIQYLANMELFADGSSDSGGGKSYMVNEYLEDNYGNSYKSSFGVKEGYVSYLVKDMGYTKLRGIVALPKGISADGYRTSAQLEIYLDDALALRSNEFTNESKPQEIDINITGVEVIKFAWTCKGGNIWSNWCYYATVFDGYVTKEN